MRALGALFVVAAFTLLGLSRSDELCRKEKTLRAFIGAFEYMRCELQSSLTALPELFSRLASRERGELASFFKSLELAVSQQTDCGFSELWTRALEGGAPSLSPEQRREIARLGQYLGRYPAAEQCAALESCIEHLEPELASAHRRAREGKKLWTGLGLASGLMLATVLI